jgi:Motility quorum-sensing regulator, toxin of MqsA
MAAPQAPSYALATVLALVQSGKPGSVYVTEGALTDAWALDFDRYDIADCILGLDAADFHKTMPAVKARGLMQDVYKTRYLGRHIYVKIQLNPETTVVVISFKEV